MSYDPTQQVPPPQGYPPQPGYPQQPGYTQQGYPPAYPQQAPAPQTYPQYGTPPPPAGAGFNFNAFWKNLGQAGQICLIGGVVLFLSLFFNWYSESISCSGPQCTDNVKSFLTAYSRTGSAWSIASGGVSLDLSTASGTQSYSFPLLWLVILASVALIALPILGALRKLQPQQTQLFVLITAGVALLIEVIYMITAFSSFSSLKNDITQSNGSSDTIAKMGTGPDLGFLLGVLATLAAGGIYIYLAYIKKPATAGYPLPYQQVAQYPGSQPYAPPTQYPGSPPDAPPTQYQQPPQYPGQQPPQYPGQ